MWYHFFGLFYSPSYLRSKWHKIHLQSITENAQYVDMITYWYCNTDYIWNQIANETELSMVRNMLLGRMNTTSFGNIAYLAIHLKNIERRNFVSKLYNDMLTLIVSLNN